MKTMSASEFTELIEDLMSSDSTEELAQMREEGQEAVDSVKELDPVLALKVKALFQNFLDGMDDIRSYLKNKTEAETKP